MNPTIIVHGGAGPWEMESERMRVGLAACKEAAVSGQRILLTGGSALDAVETAVKILEDCPALDAGKGSYPTQDGRVEMDALIMDGRNLDMGAVGAVELVQYPISLARRVMTDTAHTFLVGAGANAFADRIQFPRCTLADLLSDLTAETQSKAPTGPIGDTVGAVALDSQGNLAAATSTGGTRGKMPGRVGDTPIVGAGGYADNLTAAVSATGQGEALMKLVISKQVCDFVAVGLSAQAACDAAIQLLTERIGAEGGLIAIDRLGRIGFSFNTRGMPYAHVVGDGEIVSGNVMGKKL